MTDSQYRAVEEVLEILRSADRLSELRTLEVMQVADIALVNERAVHMHLWQSEDPALDAGGMASIVTALRLGEVAFELGQLSGIESLLSEIAMNSYSQT